MGDYHVFSSDDLTEWTDHGVIVDQNDVPWVQPDSYSMWAPDCVYKDGTYYFYFPSTPKGEGRRGFAVGVATSQNPEGPFTPLEQPIEGVNGIDPCVLFDTEGQAYIFWAGGGLRMARLKDNLTELASEPQTVEGLPQGFKEGPFAFERQGKYYLTFPWVQDKTETLAYAMSDQPMGPYEFKGVIMEQSPTGCWTNHHSIVEYKGQWYLFYHHNDYSPEFDKLRSTRIDSLFFEPDGTIRPVTATLRGVGISDARKRVELDRYSRITPGAAIAFVDETDKFKGWKVVFTQKARGRGLRPHRLRKRSRNQGDSPGEGSGRRTPQHHAVGRNGIRARRSAQRRLDARVGHRAFSSHGTERPHRVACRRRKRGSGLARMGMIPPFANCRLCAQIRQSPPSAGLFRPGAGMMRKREPSQSSPRRSSSFASFQSASISPSVMSFRGFPCRMECCST